MLLAPLTAVWSRCDGFATFCRREGELADVSAALDRPDLGVLHSCLLLCGYLKKQLADKEHLGILRMLAGADNVH